MTFEQFAAERGPVLRAALVAAYGPEVGLDAASEALAHGWEEWTTTPGSSPVPADVGFVRVCIDVDGELRQNSSAMSVRPPA